MRHMTWGATLAPTWMCRSVSSPWTKERAPSFSFLVTSKDMRPPEGGEGLAGLRLEGVEDALPQGRARRELGEGRREAEQVRALRRGDEDDQLAAVGDDLLRGVLRE